MSDIDRLFEQGFLLHSIYYHNTRLATKTSKDIIYSVCKDTIYFHNTLKIFNDVIYLLNSDEGCKIYINKCVKIFLNKKHKCVKFDVKYNLIIYFTDKGWKKLIKQLIKMSL